MIAVRRLWPPLVLALVLALGFAAARASGPARRGATEKIAFADFVSGQIYLVNPDGSGLRQLTHTSRKLQARDPAFSPNGRRLIFGLGDQAQSRIWIMHADGSHQHQLARDATGFRDSTPHYTPSGNTIVFSRCGPPPNDECAIWRVQADGTHMHALTPFVTMGVHQHTDFFPAVSPNGKWIAFTRFDADGIAAQLYVMRADGRDLRAVTPPALEGGGPAWAPDSSRIVFESNNNRLGSRIFTVRPDGSGLVALTPDRYPHNDLFASYSPNGARIAFSSDRRYSNGCCLDLFEMRADGRGEHRINVGLHKAGIAGPVWSRVP